MKKTMVAVFSVIVITILALSIFTTAGKSDLEKKQDKYKELKIEAEQLKEKYEKKNDKESAMKLKTTFVEMSKLGYEAMPEKDLDEYYERFITSLKMSLEETEQRYSSDEYDKEDKEFKKVQSFLKKSKAKLAKLEQELKDGKKSKIEVLRKLEDRSDVDKYDVKN